MKNINFAKVVLSAAMILSLSLRVGAVTDKEMEEAKAITAKYYLRYANNGSDYLDNLTPKTLSELESKLKAKEKENIKAFKSVKIPGDYQSWDHEKLIEFWSVTFFTSPSLDANAKGARVPVKKQISGMSVSAPSKEATSTEKPEDKIAENAGGQDVAENNPDVVPTAEAAVEAEQDILNDQNAIEKDAAEAENMTQEAPNHTWVYILVLAILVAIVIWLVIYAARLMSRQPREDGNEENDEGKIKRESLNSQELDLLRRRLQEEETRSADLGMELERAKLERNRLEENLSKMREELNRMRQSSTTSAAPRRTTTERGERILDERRNGNPEEDSKKGRRNTETERANREIVKVIYLGRANSRGIFVRADRRINAGNTIYRLDTNDGLVGTFHVVDEPEVVDTALSSPLDYLANGCTGEDLEDTAGVTRIVTDSAGTAIFENGYWKVLRKTRVHYE